jgi:hypothetical protein
MKYRMWVEGEPYRNENEQMYKCGSEEGRHQRKDLRELWMSLR